MRLFTVWKSDNGGCFTFIEGAGPPVWGNGTPMEEDDELLWSIEALTYNDAMTIYHEKQGWEPYVPVPGNEDL